MKNNAFLFACLNAAVRFVCAALSGAAGVMILLYARRAFGATRTERLFLIGVGLAILTAGAILVYAGVKLLPIRRNTPERSEK